MGVGQAVGACMEAGDEELWTGSVPETDVVGHQGSEEPLCR